MERKFVVESVSKNVVRGVFMPSDDQSDADRQPSGLHNYGQCEFIATKEEAQEFEFDAGKAYTVTIEEASDLDADEVVPPVQSSTASAGQIKP